MAGWRERRDGCSLYMIGISMWGWREKDGEVT